MCFIIENPVRFTKEIKVTIEHGHANHLANEYSSVAYWYASKPTRIQDVPPVEKRLPVLKDHNGKWIFEPEKQVTPSKTRMTEEMRKMKKEWAKIHGKKR